MPQLSIEIVIVLLLVLTNGVLAMSEMALVSARKIRLQQQADAGSARARAALDLAESPNRFLATVQIGITLVGILAGAFGGATLASSVSSWLDGVPVVGTYSGVAGILIVVLVITYLTLVIGELVPKRLALHHPETIAKAVARPMGALSSAARPIVALLGGSTDAVLRLLPISTPPEPVVTEEDVKHMIHEGARTGVFEISERDMAVSVFRLADRTAGAVMTPRRLLVYLDIDDAPAETLAKVAANQFTIFPVCQGDLDNLLGIVNVKTLWSQLVAAGGIDLRAAMEPPMFVPESLQVLKLTDLFRSTGSHKALVVDEYGVLQGLVTMTDVLEQIVGDLDVGPAPDEPPVTRREDGSWLIDGMLSVDAVEEALAAEIFPPSERMYYQTLGGFMMSRLDRVPSVADSVEWRGWRFEVVDMDGRRVDKVLVSFLEEPVER